MLKVECDTYFQHYNVKNIYEYYKYKILLICNTILRIFVCMKDL